MTAFPRALRRAACPIDIPAIAIPPLAFAGGQEPLGSLNQARKKPIPLIDRARFDRNPSF